MMELGPSSVFCKICVCVLHRKFSILDNSHGGSEGSDDFPVSSSGLFFENSIQPLTFQEFLFEHEMSFLLNTSPFCKTLFQWSFLVPLIGGR